MCVYISENYEKTTPKCVYVQDVCMCSMLGLAAKFRRRGRLVSNISVSSASNSVQILG